MNLTTKDLNLLYVLQILMEERNVSKAAKRLRLTQPAVSNALSRLRRDFDDPLLVRSSKGMTPTPLALKIWPMVNTLCEQATEIFFREAFDVADQASTFRFATTDYFEAVFLPKMLGELQRTAPRVTLVMRPTAGSLPIVEMEGGFIDFAAGGFFGRLPEGFHGIDLFQESFTCVVRKDHPRVKKHMDLETYISLDHILVTLQGDLQGAVDRALAKRQLTRRIVAGVMSFHSPINLGANSDFVATIPTRIALTARQHLPIQCFPLPLEVPGYIVQLVWHARTHSSRPHAWMRGELIRIAHEFSLEMSSDRM
jgi:DNA-binding transcriptional LysR family regulator